MLYIPSSSRARLLPHQRGVSLLELMVGLSIGLLVIAVAIGALMVSRGVTNSVTDATNIQQHAAHALRVIGQQLRQAGSLYLNPDPTSIAPNDVLSAVVFEIKADSQGTGGNSFTLDKILSGNATSLTTGFRRYKDNVFFADNASNAAIGTDFLARNCIGAPGNSSIDQLVESNFTLTDGNLRCGGNNAAAQPITQNVAQFQVTYLVQTVAAGSGASVQYRPGSDMPAASTDPLWRNVQGVQVCLVLYGNEAIDMPANSSYTDCDGNAVDMTTIASPRTNRMHMLFRNTFQLRSQGLPTL
ncbi:MAG: PilW family protein [Comamonas sp.]|nr:PilW family protein [Comamonas sp.]